MSVASGRAAYEERPAPLLAKFREFCRLMGVVLLQDMRTRYGTSYFGYLIVIAWPLGHTAILLFGYLLRTQIAPVGDSPAMFAMTGVLPYIICLYPARTVQMSIFQNRQLMNIPVIQPLHLIMSRSILAMLNSMIVMFIVMYGMYLAEVEIVPLDVVEASKAIGAAIFLGVGLGIFNVVMVGLMGMTWTFVFLGLIIGLYLTSGVYIPTASFPEELRQWLIYNPLLNIVEWLRSAYYLSYDTSTLNRSIIFIVGGVSLALGLLGERFLRGKLIS